MKEKSGILKRIRRRHPHISNSVGPWESASSLIQRKRRMTSDETLLATMRRDENWHHD